MKYLKKYDALIGQDKIIVSTGNNFDIFDAVNNNDIKLAKELIKKGANINMSFVDNFNTRYDNGQKFSSGDTPLIAAIYYKKDPKMVKFLIDAGADVNISDKTDTTPLMCAALKGDILSTKYLIEANADIDKKSRDGCTSLMLAARHGHIEVVEELIDAGANVFILDDKNRDFYDIAANSDFAAGVTKYIEEKYPELIAAKKYNL